MTYCSHRFWCGTCDSVSEYSDNANPATHKATALMPMQSNRWSRPYKWTSTRPNHFKLFHPPIYDHRKMKTRDHATFVIMSDSSCTPPRCGIRKLPVWRCAGLRNRKVTDCPLFRAYYRSVFLRILTRKLRRIQWFLSSLQNSRKSNGCVIQILPELER